MTEPLSMLSLDPARLSELLGDDRNRFAVDILPVCESTSVLLLDRAEQGAPSGSVVVAECQTAGRGSQGRSWLMTPGDSLAFSALWHFPPGLYRLVGLSLGVGVAIARALKSCGAEKISLKWPNDILCDNAKLGGVLIDLQEKSDYAFAVIGVGLNLRLPKTKDISAFSLPPAALDQLLFPLPDRESLLAALLRELFRAFDLFAARGFIPLRDEWQALNAWQGRVVRVLRNNVAVGEGVCRGVDEDGALLIQTDGGVERCLSGDLSLRVL